MTSSLFSLVSGRTLRVVAAACTVAGALGAATAPPCALWAQQPTALVQTNARDRTAALEAAIMSRTVSLRLDRVALRDALAALARRAGLRLVYSRQALPVDKVVSLVADRIMVRDALSVLLQDTGVEPVVSESGQLWLRPGGELAAAERATQPIEGTIAGKVTDLATKAPLDQVAVRLDGSGLGAVTTNDGRYMIRNIPRGTYRITARRVGYTPLTTTVAIVAAADSTATVDFALVAVPTRLNEMVTTAVGDQRRYEVGNVISTINADSIAPTAPITSLTDLISARAPGVEVEETGGGLTGSGEAIRIRGLTSLALQNDPILIVDGVRQDNAAGGDIAGYNIGGDSHPTPSRLNDLDFSDIATIDVLKGPAASTEYGTDAANGVIVITTKHGAVGHPQWRVSAEQTGSALPERFPDGYYSWGHTTDGANTPVDCPVLPFLVSAGGYARAAGNCAIDSVTRWNPLNHSAYSIFGTGHRAKYDLSLSGGSDATRYYLAGGLTNERGIVQMPEVFRQLATRAGVTLPRTAFDANTEDQRSLRANTVIRIGPTADLTATGAYLSTYQRTPETAELIGSVLRSPALRDSAHFYGYDGFGGRTTPFGLLGSIGSQRTDRFVGGLTGTWRPATWLSTHATVGLDHGSQGHTLLTSPGPRGYVYFRGSSLGQQTGVTDLYSGDLRATATGTLSSAARAITSVGLQVVDSRNTGQTAFVTPITATNETLNGYANVQVAQLSNRAATFGGYGEEQLALADRLFLTGAIRLDAGSGFGSAYHTATYPKASVSWLALNSDLATLRLRGAFGESGVQPDNGASFQLYQAVPVWSSGQAAAGTQLSWPGNPSLRPERTAEFEGGADVGLWGNRVSLEVTGYSKRTQDALVNVNLGFSLGSYLYQENIGTVRNTGVEGTVTAALLQSRALTWNATLNAGLNHNRLLHLAPGVNAQPLGNGALAIYRQAVGYPLYGYWAQRVSYADLDHDGIIETNEITIADSASYVGSSQPTRQASLATHIGLVHGTVTVSGLVDYRGGYRIYNQAAFLEEVFGRRREGNDTQAPLALQARYAAAQLFNNALFVEDGTFVRFRELGVTYALPARMAHKAHVADLSLTGAVRNLALWTRYSGVDPEVTNTFANNILPNPTTGGFTVNNDIRGDAGAVPLARYFVLRLTAGL